MEFLENRRSWENQKPPEHCQKSGLFWASPFTMHLVCTLLIQTWKKVAYFGFFPSFQNHNTHETIIFELFRALQLQLSGVFRINLHYSFLGFLSRMQLQEIIPTGSFKNFLQLQLHDLMFSKFKYNDFEKNGKFPLRLIQNNPSKWREWIRWIAQIAWRFPNWSPLLCEPHFGALQELQVGSDSCKSLERYGKRVFSANRFAQIAPIGVANRRAQFRKRAVLANVPSFRLWYSGTPECTLVPVFGTGEHSNVPSCAVFWCRGTSTKTTLLETTLSRTPIMSIILSGPPRPPKTIDIIDIISIASIVSIFSNGHLETMNISLWPFKTWLKRWLC